jgi:hypothetical protein
MFGLYIHAPQKTKNNVTGGAFNGGFGLYLPHFGCCTLMKYKFVRVDLVS